MRTDDEHKKLCIYHAHQVHWLVTQMCMMYFNIMIKKTPQSKSIQLLTLRLLSGFRLPIVSGLDRILVLDDWNNFYNVCTNEWFRDMGKPNGYNQVLTKQTLKTNNALANGTNAHTRLQRFT